MPTSALQLRGVSHQFLINKIKKGQCSILEALSRVQKNRSLIALAKAGSDQALKTALADPAICYCVECGLLELDRVPKLSQYGIHALKTSPVLLRCLESGELSMQEVETMTYDQMAAFGSAQVCEYLTDNKLLIKEVLNMTLAAVLALDNLLVRQCMANGTLPRQIFLQLSNTARWAFQSDIVKAHLKANHLNICDVCNMTMCALSVLKAPAVQEYLRDNPLRMARILNCTGAASTALGLSRVEQALKENTLSVEEVLVISEKGANGFYDGLFNAFVRDGTGGLRDYFKLHAE